LRSKKEIREYIWDLLYKKGVWDFPPPYGRIPNFKNAKKCADLLRKMEIWKNAKVLKINPDSPQYWVRYYCLCDRKILVMPTPRLREGFLLLEPQTIPESEYRYAAKIKGAFMWGKKVKPWDLPEIDLIVEGSVAVTLKGARIGKGEGYGEIEYAILRQFGKVKEETPIVTTIHNLQIVDDFEIDEWDVPVDYIVLPDKIIETRTKIKRPEGILWDKLKKEKLEEIPLLREIRKLK